MRKAASVSLAGYLFRAADPALDDKWWAPAIPGGGLSQAGVIVTPDTALQVSTVYRCVSLIANGFASLPGGVFERVDSRTRRETQDHDAQRIFWVKPNPYQTPFAFKRMLMGHLALRGNCYARIYQGTEGPELWPLHPDRVLGPELLPSGRLRYVYTRPDTGQKEKYLGGIDIMALTGLSQDGLRGLAVSSLARDSIGLSMATEQHGARLFSMGVRLAGALKLPAGMEMGEETKRYLSKAFREEHRDYGLPVLEDGMEFTQMGMSSEDAQFLECIVPETEIALADGTRKRADEVVVGDFVFGWSEVAGLVPSRVQATGDNGVRAVLTLRTHRGREITVTRNHPFLASRRARCEKCGRSHRDDPSMASGWIQAERLAVGDYLATLDGAAWPGTSEVGVEDAYFIGAMLGDGSIRRKQALGFSNQDAGVLEAVGASAARFGAKLRYRSGVDYEFSGGAKIGRPAAHQTLSNTNPLRAFFSEMDLLGTDSYTKFIPPAIYRSGPEQVRAVLAGLFDTDGSVRRTDRAQPMAYLCTVSRRLAADTQHGLALVGIQATIRTQAPGRPREAMRYEVMVCGRENIRRLSTLPLRHARKSARLATWAAQEAPNERDVFRKMDRIVAITAGVHRSTIALTVEGTHSHVTGGLISHNTRKFEVADIARWFGVPPHMIGDVERSTSWGTGIENQTIQFVTDGLLPWVVLWEQTIKQTLIPEPGLYAKFNINARLRADSKTRFEIYQIGIQQGIYSPNDCRAFEDENPREGGDVYVVPRGNNEPAPPPGPPAPAPSNQSAEARAAAALELSRGLAVGRARDLLREEQQTLMGLATEHSRKPEAWRASVAAFYGRFWLSVTAAMLCSKDAALNWCIARRDVALKAGIAAFVEDGTGERERDLVQMALAGIIGGENAA